MVLGSNKGRFKTKNKIPQTGKQCRKYFKYVYVSKRNFHDPKSRSIKEVWLPSCLESLSVWYYWTVANGIWRSVKPVQIQPNARRNISVALVIPEMEQSTNWSPCQMIGKLQSLAKIVSTLHSEINEFKIKIIIHQPPGRWADFKKNGGIAVDTYQTLRLSYLQYINIVKPIPTT